MKIILNGFRVYESLTEHAFPSSGMCLIQGNSGHGKTTLFTSVSWALYGRESDTYTWSSKRKVCSVYVELDDGVTVHRQKNPERLELTLPDGRHLASKDEAQQEIIKRYGLPDVWEAAAYLKHEERNPLLSGSSADKVCLLEALAFHVDTPAPYLAAAQDHATETGRLLRTAQAVAEHTPPAVSKAPLETLSHPLSHEYYNDARAADVAQTIVRCEQQQQQAIERQLLERQLAEARVRVQTLAAGLWPDPLFHVVVPKILDLERRYNDWNAAIEGLPEVPDGTTLDALADLRTQLQALARQNDLCARYRVTSADAAAERARMYESTLAVWSELPHAEAFLARPVPPATATPDHPPFSAAVLHAMRTVEATLASLGLAPEELPEALVHAQTTVAMEKAGLRYRALQTLYQTYEAHIAQAPAALGAAATGFDEASLAEAVQATAVHLEHERRGRDVHACPKCRASLRWVNHTLTQADAAPSNEAAIRATEQSLAWLQHALRLVREISATETVLSESGFDEDALEAWAEDDLPVARQLLALPAVPAGTVSVAHMTQHNAALEYAEKQQRFAAVTRDHLALYQNVRGDKNAIVAGLVACQQLATEWIDASAVEGATLALVAQWERRLTLDAVGGALNDEFIALDLVGDEPRTAEEFEAQRTLRAQHAAALNEVSALEAQLKALAARPGQPVPHSLQELRRYAEELSWVPRYLADASRFEQAHQAFVNAQAASDIAGALVDKIKRVEYQVLEDYLETFNTTLASILTDIFDDPITVTLELLTDKKPDIKWRITYKGGQNQTFKELSSGEKARVSFAVTLVLASTSTFPALLLDECFGGALDATSRGRCLDVLRRMLPHKPTLLIAHGEVEGDYDTTLSM